MARQIIILFLLRSWNFSENLLIIYRNSCYLNKKKNNNLFFIVNYSSNLNLYIYFLSFKNLQKKNYKLLK